MSAASFNKAYDLFKLCFRRKKLSYWFELQNESVEQRVPESKMATIPVSSAARSGKRMAMAISRASLDIPRPVRLAN